MVEADGGSGSTTDPGSGGSTRMDPFGILLFARTLGENSPFGPITNALLLGITGTIVAVGLGLVDFVQAIFSIFNRPIFAGGAGGADIIGAFLGGIADLINTGAAISADALNVSPVVIPLFAFGYGIAVAGIGAFVMIWFLRRSGTSDFVLGLASDFPIIGTEEEDED